MIHISFDPNSLINVGTVVIIGLTIVNYILSLSVNRKQRKKLAELEKTLKKLNNHID